MIRSYALLKYHILTPWKVALFFWWATVFFFFTCINDVMGDNRQYISLYLKLLLSLRARVKITYISLDHIIYIGMFLANIIEANHLCVRDRYKERYPSTTRIIYNLTRMSYIPIYLPVSNQYSRCPCIIFFCVKIKHEWIHAATCSCCW